MNDSTRSPNSSTATAAAAGDDVLGAPDASRPADASAAPADVVRRLRARSDAEREKLLARRAEELVWVKKAVAGDAAAFEHLVRANQKRLLALAYGIVHRREEAQDVVQDTFIKAYTKLPEFAGQSSFSTWIYRICVNVAIDKRRSDGRRPTVSADITETPVLDDMSLYADVDVLARLEREQPDRVLDNRALGQRLQAAMAQISPDHRAVLLLREVDGLAYGEIAEVLGIPEGTVMSRLFHARRQMQQRLGTAEAASDGVPHNTKSARSDGDATGPSVKKPSAANVPSEKPQR